MKSSKCTGDWGFEDIKKHQVQRLFEVWGNSYIRVEELPKCTYPSVLVELVNRYLGELLGFESNLERASKEASDEVTLESPQQHAPNLQMASNTCTDLIIHPVNQLYHLNATHSNISLGIALKNLANKNASSHILFASEIPSSEQPM